MSDEILKLQTALDQLLPKPAGLKILEAGCGSASWLTLPAGSFLTGIDLSQKQLERNQQLNEKIQGDVETYPLPPATYDLIISWNVLEHLSNPEKALLNFFQTSKPGGLIVLALPNVWSLKGLITKLTPLNFHIWVYRHLLNYPEAGTDDHGPFKTFLRLSTSPNRLKKFAMANGLSVAYFDQFEDQREKEIRQKYFMVNLIFRCLRAIVRLLTLGKIDWELTDYIIVLKK